MTVSERISQFAKMASQQQPPAAVKPNSSNSKAAPVSTPFASMIQQRQQPPPVNNQAPLNLPSVAARRAAFTNQPQQPQQPVVVHRPSIVFVPAPKKLEEPTFGTKQLDIIMKQLNDKSATIYYKAKLEQELKDGTATCATALINQPHKHNVAKMLLEMCPKMITNGRLLHYCLSHMPSFVPTIIEIATKHAIVRKQLEVESNEGLHILACCTTVQYYELICNLGCEPMCAVNSKQESLLVSFAKQGKSEMLNHVLEKGIINVEDNVSGTTCLAAALSNKIANNVVLSIISKCSANFIAAQEGLLLSIADHANGIEFFNAISEKIYNDAIICHMIQQSGANIWLAIAKHDSEPLAMIVLQYVAGELADENFAGSVLHYVETHKAWKVLWQLVQFVPHTMILNNTTMLRGIAQSRNDNLILHCLDHCETFHNIVAQHLEHQSQYVVEQIITSQWYLQYIDGQVLGRLYANFKSPCIVELINENYNNSVVAFQTALVENTLKSCTAQWVVEGIVTVDDILQYNDTFFISMKLDVIPNWIDIIVSNDTILNQVVNSLNCRFKKYTLYPGEQQKVTQLLQLIEQRRSQL